MLLLLAIVVVLWILASQLDLTWWGALIVAIGLPLLCLIVAYVFAIFFFSDRTIKAFGSVKNLLRWEDCRHCTAGSQWWNGEYWGPIPLHVRQMTKGGRYIESAQANIRKCSKCVGGGWWLPKIPRLSEPPVIVIEPKEEKPWWPPDDEESP